MDIKYENRIIAYIDILGFTDLIKQTDNDKDPIDSILKLENIYGIVSSFQKYFNQIKSKQGLKNNCSVTMFSDLIVFSLPQRESYAILVMFDALKKLQVEMLNKNILLRGSIVFGKLIHKDNLIIGPALINAYNVESKSAVYPRIVIDPNVANLYIRKNGVINPSGHKIKDFDYEFTFNDDFDGTYYIDYFNFVEDYLSNSTRQNYYNKMAQLIKKGKLNKDTGIRMKYLWMAEKLKDALETIRDLNEKKK